MAPTTATSRSGRCLQREEIRGHRYICKKNVQIKDGNINHEFREVTSFVDEQVRGLRCWMATLLIILGRDECVSDHMNGETTTDVVILESTRNYSHSRPIVKM